MKRLLAAALLLSAWQAAGAARVFVHPGMLHSRADLDRMRLMIQRGNEPWKAGFAKVQAAPISKLDYRHHAVANLCVASGGAAGTGQQDDASAAHFHAVQWYVTGNEAHALKAMEILNAWSGTLQSMCGSNARLQSGITGYHFCNAAEILKHLYGKWPLQEQERFKKMMTDIYYPTIQNWAPTFNGNWDAYMELTMMSIAIFAEDEAMFDKAVDWYMNGKSKGSLKGYIYEDGRCQESTRDQMHVQMGLGAMAGACETGYHQGVDMYGAYDNWFLKGLEFSAKYNLGYSVPGPVSSSGRGQMRPMWEISYNHYVRREGLPAQYVTEVVTKKRPEGYEQDYISFGTFLFYTDPNVPGGSVSVRRDTPTAIAVDRSAKGLKVYSILGREIAGPAPGRGLRVLFPSPSAR